MGKVRRGGYVFVTWKGDHGPRHVHVYKDRRFVVKWDLANGRAMEGSADERLRRIIAELEKEGRI